MSNAESLSGGPSDPGIKSIYQTQQYMQLPLVTHGAEFTTCVQSLPLPPNMPDLKLTTNMPNVLLSPAVLPFNIQNTELSGIQNCKTTTGLHGFSAVPNTQGLFTQNNVPSLPALSGIAATTVSNFQMNLSEESLVKNPGLFSNNPDFRPNAGDPERDEFSVSKGEGPHICDLCKKRFSNKKEFLKHQYNHKQKSSFYCAFCYKTFLSEFAFKRHNKIHEKKKSRCIQCKVCNEEFHFIKDLEEHHREKHLNQKSFCCTHCDAMFSWRENLHKHMRMHSKLSSVHKCEKCQKGFMDNISLRLHKCNKDGVSSESIETKKYVCKICKKSFQFDFSFQAHMNSHEGPVAFSAYKKLQEEKAVQKQQQAKKAVHNLATEITGHQSKDKFKNKLKDGRRCYDAIDKVQNDANTTAANTGDTSVAVPMRKTQSEAVNNYENLQEIVLEIVDVNEMKSTGKGSLEGVEILAQGPEPCSSYSRTDTAANNLAEQPARAKAQMSEISVDEKDKLYDNPNLKNSHSLLKEQLREDTAPLIDHPIKTTFFAGKATSLQYNPDDNTIEGKRKRRRPLLYDYVMTEETPFKCLQCLKEFRWEISLNIHLQEHMAMSSSSKGLRPGVKRKVAFKGHHQSKIVCQRVSSEDEDEHGDFLYPDLNVASGSKKKRGRPRKNPMIDGANGTRKKRGRPPKLATVQKNSEQHGLGSETMIIRVKKGAPCDTQYPIKKEEISTGTTSSVTSAGFGKEAQQNSNLHIPKHRLIRFYLLRQLKLSRKRGFFPCRFCNKPFSCKASLNMHILRHTGKGAYRCKHCSQKFPDHRTLVLHRLIEEEENDNNYQCTTCSRICSSKSNLILHLQRHLARVWPSCQARNRNNPLRTS